MGVVRFGLFGFKIQIQPGFWLLAALLLLSAQRDWARGVLLVGMVFGSVLAHELGHALVAKRAGAEPLITIHALGGLTSWEPKVTFTRGRAIAIALAGPFMGLLLCALAVGALRVFHPPTAGAWVLAILAYVNGFWSIINLLPVVPFDGGLVLAHLLGPKRRAITMHVSLAVGLAVALLLAFVRLPIAGVMIGISAVMHFIGMSRASEHARRLDPKQVERMLSEAQQALDRDEVHTASRLSEAVLGLADLQDESRRLAAQIAAWSAVGLKRPERAARALDWLAPGPVDPLLAAAVLELEGQTPQAVDVLRRALTLGDQRAQVAASLVRLLLAEKRYAEAALTTIEILAHVTADEARQVALACRRGDRPVPAAELFMALYAETGELDDLAWALLSYRESSNGDALEAALSVAVEQGILGEELLGSQALSNEPGSEDLRRLIVERLQASSQQVLSP